MSEPISKQGGAPVRFPPPLVYVIALLVGQVLTRFVVRIPLAPEPALRWGLAGVCLAGGLFLMVAAVGLFRRTGQDPKPWLPSPEILTTGIYGLTRNPMYVGMALLQMGIGLAVSDFWIVILAPVSLVVVYLIAVRHEEAYLEHRFGDAYRNYRQRVRRWI